VGAATKVLLTSVVLSNPGINETVRRTRGVISIRSDQSLADEEQTGAYGLVVVSDLAIAAGAASIPGPITDASDDGWFVWVPFCRSRRSTDSLNADQFFYDSKAMRRIEEGFSVVVMVENASATDGLRILDAISLLSSLS